VNVELAKVQSLVVRLQQTFVKKLEAIHMTGKTSKGQELFEAIVWLRDSGVHGGGKRYQTSRTKVFNRASVNVSAVHYKDKPRYPIDTATALSVIIHPHNPHAPSMHFHLSYIEPRGKKPYWRMITDLNPSIPNDNDASIFESSLKGVKHITPALYAAAQDFGDRYFYIPALGCHRGVSHLFINKISSDDFDPAEALELATDLAEKTIDTYVSLVQGAIDRHPEQTITDAERAAQLAYHTLYTFQVLTLDRGTTHGLLAHAENDIGTLGSLPCKLDSALMSSWVSQLPAPQDKLLQNVIDAVSNTAQDGSTVCEITDQTRADLANVVRRHYRANRGATKMQAEMDMDRWTIKLREALSET